MPPISVQSASQDRRKAVLDIMTLGFASDPVMRWTWPDPATFLATFPKIAEGFGGRGFAHDSVFETICGRAAAMWLPPDVEPDSEAMAEASAASIRPDRIEETNAFFSQMADYHPQEPCWYLPLIAADPAHTGQGLGAALMRHALAKVDADGLPAYLESSNPRNISLYQRYGFEVMGEIQAGSSPVMTPMIRPARA